MWWKRNKNNNFQAANLMNWILQVLNLCLSSDERVLFDRTELRAALAVNWLGTDFSVILTSTRLLIFAEKSRDAEP